MCEVGGGRVKGKVRGGRVKGKVSGGRVRRCEVSGVG